MLSHNEVCNAELTRSVSPEITELPVTILYSTAPKAAAAIVPTAYSTVDIPASQRSCLLNSPSPAVLGATSARRPWATFGRSRQWLAAGGSPVESALCTESSTPRGWPTRTISPAELVRRPAGPIGADQDGQPVRKMVAAFPDAATTTRDHLSFPTGFAIAAGSAFTTGISLCRAVMGHSPRLTSPSLATPPALFEPGSGAQGRGNCGSICGRGQLHGFRIAARAPRVTAREFTAPRGRRADPPPPVPAPGR